MKHFKRVVRACRLPGVVLAALLMTGAAHAEGTLYERIGGDAKMKAVVDEFTNIVLADPRINFTFAESDIPKFKKLLFEQLCNITGGPCQYTGRTMKESHEKLNSTNAQFNALAEDLYIAFERTHVPYRLQNKVMVLLAPMQRDIVKKKNVATK
jgi:hemoglobin